MDVVEKKVEIPLNALIQIPEEIVKKRFNQSLIYLSPSNASWVVVKNEKQEYILESIQNGHTVAAILDATMRKFEITEQEALEELKIVLVEIDYKHFYAGDKPDDIDFLVHPLLLHFYATDYCNFNCRHCYREAKSIRRNDELLTSECLGLFDQFIAMNGQSVNFSGGEALTRPDIFELMSYCKKRGLKTQVLSNGALINSKDIVEKIVSSANRIQISLDGTSAETNDCVRGKGSFALIKNALLNLKQYAEDQIEISLGVTVTKTNYQDLQKNLIPFIKELNFPKLDIILGKAQSHGRATECGKDLVEGYRILSPIIAGIISGLEELGWWNPGRYKRIHKRLHNCSWGASITVDSRGNVLLCSFGEQPFSNIKQQTLKEIYMKMKEEHKKTYVDNIEKCRSCEIKYICGGGCKVRNLQKNGDVYRCDCDEDFKNYFYYQMERNQLS